MIYRTTSNAFDSLGSTSASPSSAAAGDAEAASSPRKAAQVLAQAAGDGDIGIIQAYLRSGPHADPDARSPHTGHTLLWDAAFGGHEPIVRLLANHGAEFDTCFQDIDDPFTGTTVWRQCSPLWLSIHCGHTAVTRLLLDVGAAPERTNQPFRMAECHGGRESRARTPFFHACCIGNVDAVSLLAGRSEINATNPHDGLTAFWAAACMGHEPICRLLYAAGADPSSTPHRSTHAAHVGASPLWVACEQGRTEIVELLASLGLHDEEAERLESHPRGTVEDAARCNGHADILSYLKLLRAVEPTRALCAAKQRLSLAKSMNARLGAGASSKMHTLPPDLIETISHVLLRNGWCPGGGLVRRTLALRCAAEVHSDTFGVAQSRAAVARTFAAAAQATADAAAAELARCEEAATLAAVSAAQCTVMATSSLQLLEQARQPARAAVESAAVAKRHKSEASAAAKDCAELAARSITAESSMSIEVGVQVAVEQAAAVQTAAAMAAARAAALAEAARTAEPELRRAEQAARLAVTDAAAASDELVATKQRLVEVRQPMVRAVEAQASAAAAELASTEAERWLEVANAGAGAARRAEVVEHVALCSRALRKESRAFIAAAECDMESSGWLQIDDEVGVCYYNARTERRTRAQPQALREVITARAAVRARQQANLLLLLPAVELDALTSVVTGEVELPITPVGEPSSAPVPAMRNSRRRSRRRERSQPFSDEEEEEEEESPPGTPPSESESTTSHRVGFSGVLWDGPLPPLFVRHSMHRSSSASSDLNLSSSSSSSSSSSGSSSGGGGRGGGRLVSKMQAAMVANEQLAVAAAAARAKSAQLLSPSVLGMRMEWAECLKNKNGRMPGSSSGGGGGSRGSNSNARSSQSRGLRAGRISPVQIDPLDLCRVE